MPAKVVTNIDVVDGLVQAGTSLSTSSIDTYLGTDGSGNLAFQAISGLGTVTEVDTGTGLTGGPITSTGTISISPTGVTAGTYPASGAYTAQVTINSEGQITAESDLLIAIDWTQIVSGLPTTLSGYGITDGISTSTTAGGDLSGTYPNPTIAALQSYPLLITTPALNDVLQWNGTDWVNGPPVSASAITIGNSVIGGAGQEVLFIDGSGNLAGDPNFTWEPGFGLSLIVGTYQIYLGLGAAGYFVNSATSTQVLLCDAYAVDVQAGPVNLGPGPVTIATVPYVWPVANAVGVLTNDGSGNLSWASGGGTPTEITQAGGTVSVDASGNILAQPASSGTVTLENNAGTGTVVLANDGSFTVITPGGNQGLLCDAAGNVYVGGGAGVVTIAINGAVNFVGGSGGSLGVDTTGNVFMNPATTTDTITLNTVAYVWPTSNTVGVLTNDGSGNLSWASGGGTVTSVGLSLPSQFTVSNSPVTSTGTLTATLTAPMILADGSQAFTANQPLGANKLTGVADPTNPQDAATKNYVDLAVASLAAKDDCKAATVSALPASSYSNGTAGVGATITLTTAAVLVLDGYTPALGDRLLIKNQASPVQNGLYSLTTVGTLITQAVLTRTLDFDQPGDGLNGALVYVLNGTVNGNTLWSCTTGTTVVFNTTNINWAQFLGATYTADGTTLQLTGTTFSLITPVAVTNGGTGASLSGVPLSMVTEDPSATSLGVSSLPARLGVNFLFGFRV